MDGFRDDEGGREGEMIGDNLEERTRSLRLSSDG